MHTDNRAELQELIGPDYELQWIIGHGGMSTVWLADDTANDREVAVKVLRPEFAGTEEFLTRFRNEANAAKGIHSSNVVATYDYREVPSREGFNVCFIVMEYIRGESLADLIAREGKLDEAMALDVLEQAAHGLAVIHQLGLVHRDIKPGNLMITQNGKVKITDFGIAKAAAAVPLTRTGMVVGTAQYVSPEQAQGLEVSSASDVYSLAVVGYELLTGQRPFTGDSSVSVALAHVSSEVPPMSTTISAPTRELIGIALRKDPNTRFNNGAEFQHAIADARDGKRPVTTTTKRAVPVEPSPQESTAQLAAVTEATTLHPETPLQESPIAARPAQRPQQTAPAPKKEKSGSGAFGTGLLVALLVLLLAAAAVWAYTSGFFNDLTGGSEEPTTPATSTTAPETESSAPTETVTETRTAEETTTSRERPTKSSPSTLYNSPETERPSEDPTEPSNRPSRQPSQPSRPTQQPPEPPATQPEPPADGNPIPSLEIPGLPNP
ncbi:serine/threonine-protein kinase [Corynebacterium sp. p3-SID1194]|uniref:serine/threonine-protein kinase n=1 Tax=Corynebacterium sp. p3-SID1194 TaxID=2916105 RepID=UPI0021A72EC1|nr:serine/threonine protein kinase [Corynebacterium sp. p3-SID1194]MCT1451025.1 protein kinase [Corynebacterium sp. p3-SID1194]